MSAVMRFLRLPAARRLLLVQAALALAVVALLRVTVSFARIAAMVRRPVAQPPTAERQARLVAETRWAVRAAAARAPWRALCFEQGFAAHWLLARKGVPTTLHYGVANAEGTKLISHVWVQAGALDVVGCELRGQFKEIARFPLPLAEPPGLSSSKPENDT